MNVVLQKDRMQKNLKHLLLHFAKVSDGTFFARKQNSVLKAVLRQHHFFFREQMGGGEDARKKSSPYVDFFRVPTIATEDPIP
jgi:hypothetical protein